VSNTWAGMDYLEKAIVNNLKSGDAEAFEYVFRNYFKKLFNYADNLLRNNYQAEEVVTDVFTKLWTNRSQLTVKTSLHSYLFRAVYNNCLNQIRRVKVENKYKSYFLYCFKEMQTNAQDYPFARLVEKELEQKIDEIITSLPEQCRAMFLLSRDEGLTHEEIAVRFGVSVNTVHTQIARALKKFREELQNYLLLLLVLFIRIPK
jgi:RNA polymerase sigma-70 factor (ECF subfamily)